MPSVMVKLTSSSARTFLYCFVRCSTASRASPPAGRITELWASRTSQSARRRMPAFQPGGARGVAIHTCSLLVYTRQTCTGLAVPVLARFAIEVGRFAEVLRHALPRLVDFREIEAPRFLHIRARLLEERRTCELTLRDAAACRMQAAKP